MATSFAARFRGLVLPIRKWSGGYFSTRTTRDLIQSSIRMILMTRLGERVMLPEFGSRLHELVFNQMDDVLKQLARTYVIDAIGRWEKRITIQDVKIITHPDTHEFDVFMSYVINESADQDSLVLEGFGGSL